MSDNLSEVMAPHLLGERLQQARKARGLTQQEVADKLGLVRTTLVAIEKGERKVQPTELVEMSKLYGRAPGDFVGRKANVTPFVPQFRLPPGEQGVTETELLASATELESLAEDYVVLEQINGRPLRPSFPPVYSLDVPGMNPDHLGEDVAAAERTRLGIGDGPIPDLRALLEESMGIRVFYVELPPRVGGLFACNDQLGACIAINRKHPPQRGNWSLAHEYAHFLTTRYHADVDLVHGSWGKSAAERFADAFAKNFLMPRTGVTRRLSESIQAHGKGVTIADVMALAALFRVSAEAMFRRLEELKRLPFGKWEELKKRGFRSEQARQSLGLASLAPSQPMLPLRYRLLAKNAYEDRGEITEGQLAKMLRMDRVSARLELERLSLLADSAGADGYEPVDLPDLSEPVAS